MQFFLHRFFQAFLHSSASVSPRSLLLCLDLLHLPSILALQPRLIPASFFSQHALSCYIQISLWSRFDRFLAQTAYFSFIRHALNHKRNSPSWLVFHATAGADERWTFFQKNKARTSTNTKPTQKKHNNNRARTTTGTTQQKPKFVFSSVISDWPTQTCFMLQIRPLSCFCFRWQSLAVHQSGALVHGIYTSSN